ncbi:MAG: 3'(2'),5'-bisphosphate nucleotidase CysQ [Xanthomonadales bacterium]|nr:3'(2'),5'-bisphosphate nucleotidase CysQ [Xanthomonadales bacterium]
MNIPKTLSKDEIRQLRLACVAIADTAGLAILKIYDEDDLGIVTKSDDSPLTRADLASHNVIVAALEKLTPDWPVLSEESTGIDTATRRQWQRYWLVDPLDGTKEFIKRNGEFTVNIALIDKGRPILGIVQVPVTNYCYSGSVLEGAFLRSLDAEEKSIQVRLPPASPPIVVGSRSHASPRVTAYLENLGSHALTSMGSSLKFCLVASGQADLYPRLGPTMEWDTGAAQAIVEAAGGKVVRTDNTPLDYNQRETLLNPEFLVLGDSTVNWSAFVPTGSTHMDSLGE